MLITCCIFSTSKTIWAWIWLERDELEGNGVVRWRLAEPSVVWRCRTAAAALCQHKEWWIANGAEGTTIRTVQSKSCGAACQKGLVCATAVCRRKGSWAGVWRGGEFGVHLAQCLEGATWMECGFGRAELCAALQHQHVLSWALPAVGSAGTQLCLQGCSPTRPRASRDVPSISWGRHKAALWQ